tara:strand:- start:438 stop:626 length:189 start_codon:yes stop_codon:yes gene_type:complete
MKRAFLPKVNRYTRAGKKGKYIVCPHCEGALRVYHFSWSAVGCIYCKEMVQKDQWGVADVRF